MDEEKVELKIRMIIGDKKINQFMDTFDLKGEMKIYGKIDTIVVPYEEGTKLSDIRIASLLKNLKEDLVNTEYILGAIFVPGVKAGAWKDDKLKIISDGEKLLFLTDEVFKSLGFVQ